MDNKKIGKLIADLRKEKGLTQQELGDKVGVGFRAVSKWERGLTLPDITIINDLSNILGISSDELLSGQIKTNTESRKKNFQPTKKLISSAIIIITIIIIILSTFIYYNNKTYRYILHTNNKDYYIEGQVIANKKDISIVIYELKFLDKSFAIQEIETYAYKIKINNELIIGYGYNPIADKATNRQTINEFSKEFKANYNGEININKSTLEDSEFKLIIDFTTSENQNFTTTIECYLDKAK